MKTRTQETNGPQRRGVDGLTRIIREDPLNPRHPWSIRLRRALSRRGGFAGTVRLRGLSQRTERRLRGLRFIQPYQNFNRWSHAVRV